MIQRGEAVEREMLRDNEPYLRWERRHVSDEDFLDVCVSLTYCRKVRVVILSVYATKNLISRPHRTVAILPIRLIRPAHNTLIVAQTRPQRHPLPSNPTTSNHGPPSGTYPRRHPFYVGIWDAALFDHLPIIIW